MISDSSLYVVRAVAALATLTPGEFLGTSAIAERIGAPPSYLGKLLQTLSRNGLLRSRRGLGGGFSLARPAERISIYDVLDPLEDFERSQRCFLGGATCSAEEPCAVHDRWAQAREAYLEFLRTTDLASLVRNGGIPAPRPDQTDLP